MNELLNNDEMIVAGYGRFFYEVKSFDEIIKVVKDVKRIDVRVLDGITIWYDNLIYQYQSVTGMSDKRISNLYVSLQRQIDY